VEVEIGIGKSGRRAYGLDDIAIVPSRRTRDPEDVDIAWEIDEDSAALIGRLHLMVANEPGSLGDLSTIIGKNHGNISNLKITNRSIDFFEMLVDVEVQDAKHLSNIIAALRATPVIISVERARR